MLRELFVCVLVGLACVSCSDENQSPSGNESGYNENRGGDDAKKLCPAVTAANHGLQLVLPFHSSAAGHGISQSYNGSYSHYWNTRNPNTQFNDACAVDFRGSVGDQILAVAAGKVVAGDRGSHTCHDSGKVVTGGGYGNNLYVDHGNGCRTHYAHLDSISVQVGQDVVQGQLIGRLGDTGCSTGPHLHLAMHCKNSAGGWEPVRPEPLSDIEDLGSKTDTVIGGYTLPNLPVGTLVKPDSSPDIYLVCGQQKLCHYKNVEAYRSRRPWHYGDSETTQVVNVSDTTVSCYSKPEGITGTVQMKLVTCGASAYLTMSGAGETRRRVPYALGSVNAGVLLKSWGFSSSEAVPGQAECGYPLQDDLTLRPGTLIELASDNDFYVVTADAYDGGLGHAGSVIIVRRVKRLELLPDKNSKKGGLLAQPFVSVLYGSYRNVLMIPDDAAFTMTGGKLGGAPDYGTTDAVMCLSPNFKGGSDGGDDDPTPETTATTPTGPCTWHEHRCTADLAASQTCTMNFEGDTQLGTEWTTFPCATGLVCEPASGSCVAKPPEPEPAVPEPTVTTPTVPETWPSDPPHTVRCRESQGALEVHVTGPVQDALMATPTTPTSLQYGSDADGWAVPYATGKPKAAWSGDSTAMVLKLPAAATRFNLYVEDADDATRDSWFDLNQRSDGTTPWTVIGDCRLGVREIVRGAASVVETTTTVTVPTTTPETPSTPVTTDPPHTIRCTATATGMRVAVTGPVLGGGLMADPITPNALMWGSDTVGGWSVPYSSETGNGRTQTPWLGDDQVHQLTLPANTDRFNLYLADANGVAGDYWLRLKAEDGSPWTVLGDCQLGDGVITRLP